MVERPRIRFRVTPAGAAFLLLPPLLLYRGISHTHAAGIVVGIGLPSMVVLSLLFLLAGARRIIKAAGTERNRVSALPECCQIGRRYMLETDPERPGFLPGIRLSYHWNLIFGPFRVQSSAVLPRTGPGTGSLTFTRRGEWLGLSSIQAGDPFGFFSLNCPCGLPRTVFVPPVSTTVEGSDYPGRPEAEIATAPRLKEDAEERLERRLYTPGDDPRRLDWKLYARTGDMLIRVGEEGIPFRGRIWLRVVSQEPVRFRTKRQIRHLDSVLETAAALVRRLEEQGQDLRVLLPGEESWSGTEKDWNQRLAKSLPGGGELGATPAAGERLWIIAHPGNEAGKNAAIAGSNSGCRVSLGYPEGEAPTGLKLSRFIFRPGPSEPDFQSYRSVKYRRKLADAEASGRGDGIDVRRI